MVRAFLIVIACFFMGACVRAGVPLEPVSAASDDFGPEVEGEPETLRGVMRNCMHKQFGELTSVVVRDGFAASLDIAGNAALAIATCAPRVDRLAPLMEHEQRKNYADFTLRLRTEALTVERAARAGDGATMRSAYHALRSSCAQCHEQTWQ